MATPYRPVGLTLSVLAIGIGAMVLCCLVAMLAMACLVAAAGRQGAAEFLQDLRFDARLQTRLGAAIVSTLYVGIALTTVMIAMRRGGRKWTTLVALARSASVWRSVIIPALAALIYAAAAATFLARTRDRHLPIAGPTDLLLLSMLVGNLVVLAPIAEELLFRGWIYTALRRSIGIWPGGFVTAVLFASFHYDSAHRRVFLVLPLAIALAFVRERSASIRPTILLHAGYNLIIISITLAYV